MRVNGWIIDVLKARGKAKTVLGVIRIEFLDAVGTIHRFEARQAVDENGNYINAIDILIPTDEDAAIVRKFIK